MQNLNCVKKKYKKKISNFVHTESKIILFTKQNKKNTFLGKYSGLKVVASRNKDLSSKSYY